LPRVIKTSSSAASWNRRSSIWGGEFGRTPFREGRTSKGKILGRDHYPDCFTMWLAGGRLPRAATVNGETDELGFGVAKTKSTSTTSKPPSCTSSLRPHPAHLSLP